MVPSEYDSEPLNLPLNFTYTEKANAKPNASLLREGEYVATEQRTYSVKKRCHGCEVNEKANNLVVIRDQVTGETFEIGFQCMRDLYGIDVAALKTHTAQVSRARRELSRKLNLKGSTEQLVRIVREAILTYVPVPERYLRELDHLDIWNLSNAESDRLRDLHQLACYFRDWQEQPERARTRWRALQGHPAFAYDSHRDDVAKKCSRAIEARHLLPENDILALNRYLRRAAAYQPPYPVLVNPADHPDEASYVQALTTAVHHAATGTQAVSEWLTGSGEGGRFNPTKYVGIRAKQLYTVAAVWQDEAERAAERIKTTTEYWQRTRKPIFATGPVEVREFPARRGTRRNEDNELEEFDIERAFRFTYRRVAWVLQERYTETYQIWHRVGREKLERYL